MAKLSEEGEWQDEVINAWNNDIIRFQIEIDNKNDELFDVEVTDLLPGYIRGT